MKKLILLLAAMFFSSSIMLATDVILEEYDYPSDEETPRKVIGDAPAGFGASCWQGPLTGKSNYHVWFEDVTSGQAINLEDLFGSGHNLKISDIQSISFWTKKPSTITTRADWWLSIYTIEEGDDYDAGSWYDSRLHALPDYGPNYGNSFVSNTWNKWSTNAAASTTNQLVFYDSPRGLNGYYATLAELRNGEIDWKGDGSAIHDYSNEKIKSITLQTDSGWDGFDGLVDGLVITLVNGNRGIIDFRAAPLPIPIADWRFDECGNLGKDWVTTDPANATNHGAIGFVGHNNRSSMFEGNAYMDVGKPDKLNLTNNISLSTWIFAFSTGKDRQVFSKGNNKQITQYELKTNSSSQGILTFRTWNSGAKGVEAQNFRLADHLNEWIHVACTYEQTNSSNNKGTWKIYINGILNNTAENVTGPVETDRDVIIGAVRVNDDSPIQHWWDGLIDELKVYNITLSDEQIAAIFNTEQNGLSYGCNPDPDPPQYPSESSLVLWYDGLDIDGDDNYYNNPAPGTAVSDWDDKTDTEEDATMSLPARMPIYDNVGINGMPAVKFSTDYTNSGYANNDILTAPYNQEITTAEQDLWNPDAKDKDLYVVFGTSSVIDGIESENPSYYSDGRQCIFEAGGPMSGYNIYMADGKLVYGMWNRFEECFAMIPMEDLIQPNTVYLANLEYNAANKQFRAVLKDGSDPSQEYLSELIDFSGLSRDMTNEVTQNDLTAVGGAARTCYHDYNTGETYSDHFDGWIGEVQLYNKYLTPLEKNFVYPYLGMKFDEVWWPYPETGRPKQSGNWFVIKRNKADLDMVQLSTASPNPFDISTSFSLNLPETQKINVELFDVNGQKVMDIFSGSISAGIHDFTIDGANLTNGVYLFRVAGEKFSTEGKVVLNK